MKFAALFFGIIGRGDLMDWYNPEYMGTLADWVGILVTALTIFLTIRYYTKDNKRSFKIVLYPVYWKDTKDGIRAFYSEPQAYEFYAVNFSKNTDAVYFFTIVSKASYLTRLIRGIPNAQLDWDMSFGSRVPEYQNVEPRHSTKKENFESHWFFDHALSIYKETKRKLGMKKVKISIVYVNVEGKEFSKTMVFPVSLLQQYEKDKKASPK